MKQTGGTFLKGKSPRLAVLALSAAVFAGAMAVGPTIASAAGKTELVTSYPQEPPSWNYWEVGATAISAVTFMNVRQPLLELLGDGSLAPLLATSWTVSDDGLTVTFKIREANFSDGTSLDADDVVYSLLKNKESPLGAMSGPFTVVEQIEAVDDRTVKLSLSTPSQRLLTELGLRAGLVVPSGSFDTVDLAKEAVGTGPYVFAEYSAGVHVKLVRNDDYWGEEPYFQTVTHRFIPDETAAINALLAGDIDVIGGVLGEGLERVDIIGARDGFTANVMAPLEISYVFLDTTNETLQNASVRQAIAHGIERETLLIAGQAGLGEPVCQYVMPYTAAWNSDYCPYPYDVAKAKQLLEGAGVSELTLYFPYLTVAEFPALKEVLVSQMAAIGVTLDAKPLDLSTWFEQVWGDAGAYQFGSITDGVKIEAFHSSQGGVPHGKPTSVVTNEAFDNLVTVSDSIVDIGQYLAAKAEMAKVFADDAWVIPLYSKSTPSLSNAHLTGIKQYRNIMEFDLRYLGWSE
jgi:peptide/nickel transport system substrate-binding protein